jgi:hypothetical protein
MKKTTEILNRLVQNITFEVDDESIKASMLKDIDALKAIIDKPDRKKQLHVLTAKDIEGLTDEEALALFKSIPGS